MKTTQTLEKMTADITLSDLMSIDSEAAEMLASIGLEPSDHQDETLRAACKQRQWNEEEVLRWIKKNRFARNMKAKDNELNDDAGSGDPDYGENLSLWCTWLSEEKIEESIRLLREITNAFPRVHQIHGNQYTWLKDMQWHFEKFQEALEMYFKFTKKKFYPVAIKLDSERTKVLDGTVRELKRCINIIEEDQKQLKEYMQVLRTKGQNFQNPSGACSTFRILNENFNMLFSNLEQQLAAEKKHVIPVARKKLNTL